LYLNLTVHCVQDSAYVGNAADSFTFMITLPEHKALTVSFYNT